jgi:hypothetical protein
VVAITDRYISFFALDKPNKSADYFSQEWGLMEFRELNPLKNSVDLFWFRVSTTAKFDSMPPACHQAILVDIVNP